MNHFVAKLIRVSSVIGPVFITTGCAELPLIANAAEAITYAVLGAPDVDINRESINENPYASISAKIGSGPRSILVLGKKENGTNHWYSADNAVIVTRDGRVIRTAGFPENLRKTTSKRHDPVNRVLHKKTYDTKKQRLYYSRELDMDLGSKARFGIPVRSTFETIGPKEIEIAGITIKTILVREKNDALTINWSFTNHYWVDAFDGFIWKSRQHVSRSFPPIDIEILKPSG
jgi:hypothetical protein